MIIFTTSVALLSTILAFSYYWLFAKKNMKVFRIEGSSPLKEPPCLPWIPYFGSLPFLPSFSELHTFFAEKSKDYNDVAGFYLMDEYFIILNTRETMREAFVKRSLVYADRPENIGASRFLNPNNKGIFFHRYNEDFKKYHKLSLGIMNQFGFGNRIMEKRIVEEVQQLLKNLAKFKGEEFYPNKAFMNYSLNVISGLLFGQRFDDDDPRLDDLISNIKASFVVGDFVMMDKLPFIRYTPYLKRRASKLIEAQNEIFKVLKEQMSICNDASNYRPSFIKTYLEEEGPVHDREQLLYFLKDLFLAGSETTASTLEWSLVYLANHPLVQEIMWKELDSVVLSDGMVSLDSKKCLPYSEAVMCELFRIKPAAPLSVPRRVMKDTQIFDYYIKANTLVMANIHAAHSDAEVWGDPDVFRPERFIDERGEINVSRKELLVTFSLGKRLCCGEILAKQELFLSLTNLVKSFVILPPSGQTEIKVKNVVDITSKPSPFKVRLIERCKN